MGSIRVRVQKANGNRVNTLVLKLTRGGTNIGFIELQENVARSVDSLANLIAKAPCDQRFWPAQKQIMTIVANFLAKFKAVAETSCGQKTNLGTVSFDYRICDERRAVHDVAYVLYRAAGLLQKAVDALENRSA